MQSHIRNKVEIVVEYKKGKINIWSDSIRKNVNESKLLKKSISPANIKKWIVIKKKSALKGNKIPKRGKLVGLNLT
jgi:hypothetical protein